MSDEEERAAWRASTPKPGEDFDYEDDFDGDEYVSEAVSEGEPLAVEEGEAELEAYIRSYMYTARGLDGLPLPTWQIHDFLVSGSLTYIAGEPGHGKSFVAVSIACSVATGLSWYGKSVSRRGRVLYIAAEGAHGVRKRIRVWEHEHQTEVGDEDLTVLAIPVQVGSSGWRALERIIAADAYDLIIIDTQARMTDGKDENSQQDMSPVIQLLEQLRRLPVEPTVLVVHHSPKAAGEPRLRGSSALTGACEAIIGVKRTYSRKKGAGPNAIPTKIEVMCQRQKDAEEFEDMYFDLLNVDLGEFDSAILRPGVQYKKASSPVNVAVKANEDEAKKVANKLRLVEGGPDVVIDINREPAGVTHARRWLEQLGEDWASPREILRAVGKDSMQALTRAITRAGLVIETDEGKGKNVKYRLSEQSRMVFAEDDDYEGDDDDEG